MQSQPKFNHPEVLLKPLPLQQEKVRHSVLYSDHDYQWHHQGLLVRRGVHSNSQQVIQPQKFIKQVYSFDKRCDSEEKRGLWQIREL